MCRTAEGAQKSFYVFHFAEGADDGEAGGLAAKMQKKLGTEQPELPPFLLFDWTEEEWREINIAIGETDAANRMSEECAGADAPEACGHTKYRNRWCLCAAVEGVGRATGSFGHYKWGIANIKSEFFCLFN